MKKRITLLIVTFCLLACALRAESRSRRVYAQMQAIGEALEMIRVERGQYPAGSSIEISKAILAEGNYRPGKKSIGADGSLVDEWANPFVISCSDESGIIILSAGPDRDFRSQQACFYYRAPSLHSKTPNKALVPTTTAVTPPAGKEPRQP